MFETIKAATALEVDGITEDKELNGLTKTEYGNRIDWFNSKGIKMYETFVNDDQRYRKFEHDKFDRLIHAINVKGDTKVEFWYEYDEAGNCVHLYNNEGFSTKMTYDNAGNKIASESVTGRFPHIPTYKKYDTFGNVTYVKFGIYECWYEYDYNYIESGILIKKHDSFGSVEKYDAYLTYLGIAYGED